MRAVDVSLAILKRTVELLVAVADLLGSAGGAHAHAQRCKVPVPPVPSAWQTQVRKLDERTRQLEAQADALAVADALQLAMTLFNDFRTLYLSVRAPDTSAAEAAVDFLRLVLPVVFQVYLREGRSHALGIALALLIVLDRRLAEATSEATFHERVLQWAQRTFARVTDPEGDDTSNRPESVAVVMSLALVFGMLFLVRPLMARRVPWLETRSDDWRPVFRYGLDTAPGDWPAAQQRALSYALTTYFPPAHPPFLDEAAFKQLETLPRPFLESGASITIMPVPAQPGAHGGGVGLYLEGDLRQSVKLDERGSLFEVEIEPGFAVLLPVAEPYVNGGPNAGLQARASLILRLPKDGRTDPDGITLALDELRLEAIVDVPAGTPTLKLGAALRGLELSAGGLLPFRGRTDLALRYDTASGRFAFEGGLGLEVRKRLAIGHVSDKDGKPTGDSFAEATLLARLAVARDDARFQLSVEALADVTLRIARYATLSVAGSGVRVIARSAPEGDGRLLGIADVDMQVVPPSGIGLAVKIGPVQGGGMLRVGGGRVTGVVELALGKKLRLTGVGQYENRDRWLALVTVERRTPGPPFLPQGVGLLLARGRQADAQAMRAALGTGELDLVLMPQDVIANEARIMAALDTFFPPGDAIVLGVMARFAALKGEFSARIGVLAELPSDSARGIELHLLAVGQLTVPGQAPWSLDGVGLWDLGRGEGYLMLKLRDAKLWGVELTGSALVFHGDPDGDGPIGKGSWISLGGFYPGYPIPGAVMQGMTRIGLVWRDGDRAHLQVDAYLAWTPASLQFGLSATLHASYFGFGFDGHLSFDALVAFDGSCQVDFRAHLTFSVLGRTLAGFGVDATYTASDRYRLRGAAHYSFLCFSGTKHFSCDFGERAAPRLPVSEIEAALGAELLRPAAWREAAVAGVVLVARERGLTLPPDGRLHFEQNLVPLNVPIELYGMQRLAQPRALRIDVAPVGGTAAATKPRVGEFAPGLYFELSEAEALRAPVVVEHECGIELSLPLRAGAARDVADDWEEIIIDPLFVPPAPTAPHAPARHVLVRALPVPAVIAAPRPVRVRPLAFGTPGQEPRTWMHAWAGATVSAPPAPATGVMFRRAPAAAALREDRGRPSPAAAVLLEAWQ